MERVAGVGLQGEVVSKLVGWTLTILPLGPVAVSAGGEFRGIQPGGVWSRCQHPHQGGQDCCVDKRGREPSRSHAYWVRESPVCMGSGAGMVGGLACKGDLWNPPY